MGLCRYLPIPSDRMGVLWSLLNIADTIVLEYGPAGTTHFSAGFFRKIGTTQENRYFTTHMSEDDVVMGDVSRLEKAIEELDRDLAPKIIFVVASSISAVIGTDLRGVCAYMQDTVNARLITFEHAGLRGDYSAGLVETYSLIVKELVEPSDAKKPNTYSIIGASIENYRAVSDVNEIKALMNTAFNYDNVVTLFTPNSIENIKKMSSVTLNLVISFEGLKAAEYLKEKYGTPYFYGTPYGYQGVLDWLENISKIIDTGINPEVVLEIEEKLVEMSMYRRYKMVLESKKAYAYIYADYDRVRGFAKVLDEFFIDTQYKICKHSLKLVENADKSIKYFAKEKDRIDIIKNISDTLILADDISIMLADKSNVALRVSTPLTRGTQVATHMPFMGIKGADYIRETVDEYLNSLFR